jgi:hypothetical protein
VPQFAFAGSQSTGDFALALGMPQLAAQHGDQLGSTAEATRMAFGFMLLSLGLE